MEIKDRIEFRKLQAAFFAGMAEYPNDTDRMEAAVKILELFIDGLIARECSKIVSKTAYITESGRMKGRGGNGGIVN